MPDWELYRATFLSGDLKAENLSRLRAMESWLRLPPVACLAAAERAYAGKTEAELRPWYQLSRALFLHVADNDRPAVDRISAVLTARFPHIATIPAGALAGNVTVEKAGPIVDRLVRVNISAGLVNIGALTALREILRDFEALVAEAGPDNTQLPHALYCCGNTAYALGEASANLGDNPAAMDWYAKAEDYFLKAQDNENAAKSRTKRARLELKTSGDIDRAMQAILGPLYEAPTGDTSAPLKSALAYAELSQVMSAAGDTFGAAEAAGRSAAEFTRNGFADPEAAGTDVALDSWVARGCSVAQGKPVYALLMSLCNAWLSVLSSRVARYVASDPARSQRSEQLIRGMNAVSAQIVRETQAAEDQVMREVQKYFAGRAESALSPPPDTVFEDKLQELGQLDNMLLQLRQLVDQLQSAGQPVEPVIGMLDQLKPLVQASGLPLYIAKWKLVYACVYMAAGDNEKLLTAAEDTLQALLNGRLPKLSTFAQTYERTLYLEALLHRVRALLMSGREREGLDTALEAIRDFEGSRYRTNSPLRQSALLQSTVEFYTAASFAAFRLKDWETLVEVSDLIKARAAIRSRLSSNNSDIDRSPANQSLENQFARVTADLNIAKVFGNAEDLKAKRRDLWDLLAIRKARANVETPPAIGLAALQNALAEDEALVGYLFISPTVLLIMQIDRTRFDAARVVFGEEQMAGITELLETIGKLDQMGPLDLDAAIGSVGDLLIPEGTRKFLEGKSRVIISPHHSLHLFPFHATRWDGRYLIERCAVRYVPNFSSVLVPWRGNVRTGVLAVGVSRFHVPGEAWPDLPATEDQARSVAAIYADAAMRGDTLIGANATQEAFRGRASSGALSGYSTLHFGTHGTSVFASDTQDEPMESKLILSDGWIDGLELATFRLPADVAVLSACNSGQRAVAGRGMSNLPGDDIFGLQAGFFEAGVRTVMSGLWPVETNMAGAITSAFHAYYAKGDSPEIALQKALVPVCKTGTFFWAPFFLSSVGACHQS